MSENTKKPGWARLDRGGRPRRRPARWIVSKRETGGRGFLASLAVVALVGGVVATAAIWARSVRPDAHYLRAVKLVEDYEYGKNEDSKNYGNPVYRRALTELDAVDLDSVSFEDAERLEREIQRNVDTFIARLAAEKIARDSILLARSERTAIEYRRRLEQRANPRVSFPECESEEGGHGDDGHAH